MFHTSRPNQQYNRFRSLCLRLLQISTFILTVTSLLPSFGGAHPGVNDDRILKAHQMRKATESSLFVTPSSAGTLTHSNLFQQQQVVGTPRKSNMGQSKNEDIVSASPAPSSNVAATSSIRKKNNKKTSAGKGKVAPTSSPTAFSTDASSSSLSPGPSAASSFESALPTVKQGMGDKSGKGGSKGSKTAKTQAPTSIEDVPSPAPSMMAKKMDMKNTKAPTTKTASPEEKKTKSPTTTKSASPSVSKNNNSTKTASPTASDSSETLAPSNSTVAPSLSPGPSDTTMPTKSPTSTGKGGKGSGMMMMSGGSKTNSPTTLEPKTKSKAPTTLAPDTKKKSKAPTTLAPDSKKATKGPTTPRPTGNGKGGMNSMGKGMSSGMDVDSGKGKSTKTGGKGKTSPPRPSESPKSPLPPSKKTDAPSLSTNATDGPDVTTPSAPTAPVTAPNLPPSQAPVAIPSDTRVALSPWTLTYVFEQTRIPLEVEEDELTNITQNYISQFVVNRLPEVKEFLAEVDSIQFNLVEPFEVNYTATAVFAPDAEVLPALELDMVVTAAFQGDNMVAYLTIVRTLPTTNIFSTTTEAYFVMDPSDVDPQKLRNRMPRDSKTHTRVTAGAVAGAGAFVLLIVAAGATWGRQRQQHPSKKQRRGAKSNKGGDGKNENTVYYVGASNEPEDETGQMTVAGDTYMADSTVVSASSGSFLRRQTRFAEETYLIDDTQSLASRSEWGLLPINEAKSGDDCGDEELPTSSSDTKTLLYNSDVQQTSEDLLATNSPILPLRSSGENNNDCTNHFNDDSDEDDLSVDDDVPLRVIDLIKKFTPSRF